MTLPPRDPELLVHGPLHRALAYAGVGASGAALGAFLMALDAGTQGHGHGGGGNPFLMLPHQLLLVLPLMIGVALLLGDARRRPLALAALCTLAGVLLVDLLLMA